MKKLFLTFVLALAAALALAGCGDGSGAKFPSKQITLVCPWAAGGGTDRVSRFWADELQSALGKPCVVVNRTGGSGATGHSAGASAKPDGHTILMATFELSTMHRMGISELTYADYDWLMQVNADAAAIFVHKDAPWQTLGDWIEHVKANPGKTTMSGTATGGAWDLARAGLLRKAGVKVNAVTWVPTKGSAPALVELLGQHVDAIACSVPEAAAQLESGQIRALAVMSDDRLEAYPKIPTCKESGVDWTAVGWRGLGLPKGTNPEAKKILLEKCQEIIASDANKDFMAKNGFNITIRGPEEFAAFLKEQDEQWKAVIEDAGYAR
ncbi:MAG: tripartite-type tricarboxylate transporter receptor subunit TctC [Verrucomicrobiales bacterium]|jgi:tripartite-type tricarboxylate transporter receptor subunit TctC